MDGNISVNRPMQPITCDSTVMKIPVALSTEPTLSTVPPYSPEIICSSVTQPRFRSAFVYPSAISRQPRPEPSVNHQAARP